MHTNYPPLTIVGGFLLCLNSNIIINNISPQYFIKLNLIQTLIFNIFYNTQKVIFMQTGAITK